MPVSSSAETRKKTSQDSKTSPDPKTDPDATASPDANASVESSPEAKSGAASPAAKAKVGTSLFKRLANFKIKTIGVAVCVALGIVGVGIVMSVISNTANMREVSQTWNKYETGAAAKQDTLGRVRDAIGYGGVIHQFKNYVLRGDRPRIVKVQDKLRALQVTLTHYRSLGASDVEERALAQIADTMNRYGAALKTAENMFAEGRTSGDIDRVIKINDSPALAALAELDKFLHQQLKASAESVNSTVNGGIESTLVLGGALSIIVAVMFVVLLWFAIWRVIKPINRIQSAMRSLADGQTDIDLVDSGRRDEIGEMTSAVAVFRDYAIERERLESESASGQAAREKRAKAMTGLIEKFEGAIGAVLATVGTAVQSLETTSQGMQATAEQTKQQATSAAAASEEASSNASTVASAAEEMSGTINEVSGQVTKTNEVAKEAKAQAETTNERVGELSSAAQKIGDVVNLISEIAEQTNLLALNATIEAARAGEAGKGFAVVASEVKELASQTAKATEEISNQIGGIQNVTNEAVAAVQGISETIESVNSISTSVAAAMEEQQSATEEIARSIQQAAEGTNEVSVNISGVSQAANESTESANKLIDASKQLGEQSVNLQKEVESFLSDVRAA